MPFNNADISGKLDTEFLPESNHPQPGSLNPSTETRRPSTPQLLTLNLRPAECVEAFGFGRFKPTRGASRMFL